MTFEEILNQAMALQQRQGRVSYRALKRQFDLDEAYVEDIKLELNDDSPQQATGYQKEAGSARRRSKLRGIAPCKGLKYTRSR